MASELTENQDTAMLRRCGVKASFSEAPIVGLVPLLGRTTWDADADIDNGLQRAGTATGTSGLSTMNSLRKAIEFKISVRG
jgi:hypothetical protein